MFRYLALLAVSASIVVASASPARADAAAQALFDDAKRLMKEGKYDDACPKLEESQRLAPAIGTQYNLAACFEKQGKIASAWSLYLDVAGLSKSANQPDREKVARDSAAAIEGKLSRLTITVDKPPADIEVKRDGKAVGKAQWGTAIPVDPGAHEITASAPGKKTWSTSVTVDPGPSTKEVQVPELEKGPPGPTTGGMVGTTGVPPAYYDPKSGPPKPKTKRRSTGAMVGGIVGLSAGTLVSLTGLVLLADNERSNQAAGLALTLISIPLVGGGIWLTVYGAKKLPIDGAPPPEKGKAAALLPDAVGIGPGYGSLSWTFE